MKKLVTCAFAVALTTAASAIAIVENDTWQKAKELDSSQYESALRREDNQYATTPADDPLCALGPYGRTMWYKWTAPANGVVQFSTKGSAGASGALDTVMGVFAFDSSGELGSYWLESGDIALNDDAYADGTSFLELTQVYAGETYYIGIGTKASTSGTPGYEQGWITIGWMYVREWAVASFNAQGGTIAPTTVRLLGDYPLNTFGDLPEPVRGGYDFAGWFPVPEGGVQITGAETYAQLRDYITDGGSLPLYAQWKMTGLETPQFAPFTKAQVFNGAFLTSGYALVGSVQIKAAKMNAKSKTSRLSIYVTCYDTGRKFSAKGTLTFNDDGSAKSGDIIVNFKDGSHASDIMCMTVNADGTFTMSGERYLVEAAQVGGALTSGSLTFQIPTLVPSSRYYDPPTAPAGYKLIEEALPTSFEFTTASNGRKFSFPTGKALSYKANRRVTIGRPVWTLLGLDDSNPNKSQLKLSYNYKTGLFKGKFKVYMTNGANYISSGSTIELRSPKLQKYSVNVTGLVLSGRGYALSALKNTNQSWITILKP